MTRLTLTGTLATTARASKSLLHARHFRHAAAEWSASVHAKNIRRHNAASAIVEVDPACAHSGSESEISGPKQDLCETEPWWKAIRKKIVQTEKVDEVDSTFKQ